VAQYFFESANEGQFLKAIDLLSLLDSDLELKSKKEINPFESDLSAIVELDANYEQVLSKLTGVKNLDRPLDTIRPM
jgi:hypothetical protein